MQASRNTAALYDAAAAGKKLVFCEPVVSPRCAKMRPRCCAAMTTARQVVAAGLHRVRGICRESCDSTGKPGPAKILLHGHCHQKAMGLAPSTLGSVRQNSGLEDHRSRCRMLWHGRLVRVFEGPLRCVARHRRAEAFPANTRRGGPAVIVAAGTSCRNQLHDFTGVSAVHPAVLLRSLVPPV